MPFTFVEIEERKTRKLALLFFALTLIYICSIFALICGVRLFLGFSGNLSWTQILAIILLAIGVALVHWLTSIHRLIDRVLTTILARPVDTVDTYHSRFRNVVAEVSVATGGRHRIEPYVMSTPAMNACAVADFSGRAAIVVTEGLLARLNRSQLESVVGHEAAHIACGDSIWKSVFCGLFGLHEEALKRLLGLFSGRSIWNVARGRGGAIIIFVIVVLWLTNKAKRMCELTVSRAQEYRADAVGVRLTRNPLSLAEALHLMSKRWRGVGTPGESLSSIFIMDPGAEYLSERDGARADAFSTHPPTARRIELLLGMTHIRWDDFKRVMKEKKRSRRTRDVVKEKPAAETEPLRWFLNLDGIWKGPLTMKELRGFEALAPNSWVRREKEDAAMPAHKDPDILAALKDRYGAKNAAVKPSANECPNCHVGLTSVLYEGVPIQECAACRGCYVVPDQMTRIFAREDYAFPESIKRLAKTIPGVRSTKRITKEFGRLPYNRRMEDRQCPKCGSAVIRKFYTEVYLVEVEQCWMCGLTWLDKDELELLQCLYEERKSKGQVAH